MGIPKDYPWRTGLAPLNTFRISQVPLRRSQLRSFARRSPGGRSSPFCKWSFRPAVAAFPGTAKPNQGSRPSLSH